MKNKILLWAMICSIFCLHCSRKQSPSATASSQNALIKQPTKPSTFDPEKAVATPLPKPTFSEEATLRQLASTLPSQTLNAGKRSVAQVFAIPEKKNEFLVLWTEWSDSTGLQRHLTWFAKTTAGFKETKTETLPQPEYNFEGVDDPSQHATRLGLFDLDSDGSAELVVLYAAISIPQCGTGSWQTQQFAVYRQVSGDLLWSHDVQKFAQASALPAYVWTFQVQTSPLLHVTATKQKYASHACRDEVGKATAGCQAQVVKTETFLYNSSQKALQLQGCSADDTSAKVGATATNAACE